MQRVRPEIRVAGGDFRKAAHAAFFIRAWLGVQRTSVCSNVFPLVDLESVGATQNGPRRATGAIGSVRAGFLVHHARGRLHDRLEPRHSGYLFGWTPIAAMARRSAFITSLNSGRRPPTSPAQTPSHSPIAFSSVDGDPVLVDDLAPLVAWPYGHWPNFPRRVGNPLTIILDLRAILAVGATLLGPAVLLLSLRQTRRQFRLRTVHLWRLCAWPRPSCWERLSSRNSCSSRSIRRIGTLPRGPMR